jgi:hypothetical protein
VLGLLGCSDTSPLSPAGGIALDPTEITDVSYAQAGEPVQFAARVATVYQVERMLMFAGQPDTVVAAHECIIVRLNNEQETPIPFEDIQPGDSAQVNGVRMQNGSVMAHRIKICESWDVAFRDTITSIDYSAGTFTVAGRSEVITTDSATVFWGNIIIRHQLNQYQNQEQSAGCLLRQNPEYYSTAHATPLTFTDLEVGDVVEVRADIVDGSTLLAVMVKVANCNDKECITFSANLATIDVDARTVTFDGLNWLGTVCNGARLIGLDGEELTLADFGVGDYVAVKGFPIDDQTLKVCEMVKTLP